MRQYDAASMSDAAEERFSERALAHLDALFRLARHLTSPADADDLVQETYARAFGRQSQFAEGSNLRAWLFRILRNVHIDLYRRDRRGHTAFDEEDLTDPHADREPLRGDAELECLRRVVAEDIDAALASLSEDARTVVLLDLEGFTEAELAEVLGCALGTVKSRLCRARAALRKKLSDYGDSRSEPAKQPRRQR